MMPLHFIKAFGFCLLCLAQQVVTWVHDRIEATLNLYFLLSPPQT